MPAAREDAELADVLDELGSPPAFTLAQLTDAARRGERYDVYDWLKERKNRRVIPHRLEDIGYEPVRNEAAKDGLWRIDGKRQVVYARRELPQRRPTEGGALAGQVGVSVKSVKFLPAYACVAISTLSGFNSVCEQVAGSLTSLT